jgi:diguanylate cyclase (GGDEF)-like protein
MAVTDSRWRNFHCNVFRSRREPRRAGGAWHIWLSALAAAIGAALSFSAWNAVLLRENRLAAVELSARANNNILILQHGIDTYLSKLVAFRAFHDVDEQVTRKEFHTFAEGILHGQNAIQAVSWVPRIPHAERSAHELAAVDDGLPGYRIIDRTPDGKAVPTRDLLEYFPVFYTYPEIAGSRAIGLNLNEGGTRQQTLERARDSDRAATTPIFVSTSAPDRSGLFVVLPVYRPGSSHDTLEDRRSNLVGYVQGLFRIDGMIDTILTTAVAPEGLDLYFFSADANSEAPPLYFHSSRRRAEPTTAQPFAAVTAGPHWMGNLYVGDARWTCVVVPIPGGPGTASHDGSWLVLLASLLITALVLGYVWTTGRNSQRLQAANTELYASNKELDKTLADLSSTSNQLVTQNMRFDAAINNMSQALLMFDSSARLAIINHRYYEMYGLSPDVVKPGCTSLDLLSHRKQSGTFVDDPETCADSLKSVMAQGKTHEQITELPDGRSIAMIDRPMAGGGWVTTHEDITQRRQAEAKISHMALHDGLTNLPNRLFFREEMENRLARLGRDQKFAVLCLDLDHFKSVNDTLGHPIGDKLLRQAGERLRSCLREGDSVARLGGDEFAIVQGNVTQLPETMSLVARLIEVIGAPFDLDGHQVVVGVSIGVALAPADAVDPDQLLKKADMALYRAKADGRGTYRFFEPEMDARMQARRALELDLRTAIVTGEFELHYQPMVNLQTERINGFEALIRWHHPDRGMVPPLEFIPIAEETGLIVPIGEWVMRQACEEAAKWPSDISIAVNLSPAQFKTGLITQSVINALARSGLAANRLELEITESVLLLNNEATLDTLHQLRALGVRISMDDFGTGYSSLSYLRSFPFDKIKIDRSFVHNVASSEDSMAIVRAVAGLGASLAMTTIGEGVETQEELDFLKREGCTEAQGFLFSKARPAREVFTLLASHAAKHKAVA